MDIWVIVAVFVFGLTFLWLEFYLPGGIMGLIGGVIISVGVLLVFGEFGFRAGSLVALIAVLVVILMLWYWMRTFRRSIFGRQVTLSSEVGNDEHLAELAKLVGKTGVATTALLPSGKAVIDGEKHDVVAQIGSIEAGIDVEVVKVDGISVIVRPKAS
tara:strand:+ start:58325 stop:58798 length:474 start_codon:yes stop_codon:yes gene_type:complete